MVQNIKPGMYAPPFNMPGDQLRRGYLIISAGHDQSRVRHFINIVKAHEPCRWGHHNMVVYPAPPGNQGGIHSCTKGISGQGDVQKSLIRHIIHGRPDILLLARSIVKGARALPRSPEIKPQGCESFFKKSRE